MNSLQRYVNLLNKLLPNIFFQMIVMFILDVIFPIMLLGVNVDGKFIIPLIISQFIILALFIILMRYPGNRSVGFIPSSVISVYGCLILFLAIFRLNYSSLLLISSFFMSLLSGFILYFITIRFSKKRIAIIPLGNIQNLEKSPP